MKKKISILLAMILILTSIFSVDVFAATSLPSISSSKPLVTYTYKSSGKVEGYTSKALKTKTGNSITCASTECKIIAIKDNAVQVKYKTNGKTKTEWFSREAFTYRDLAKDGAKSSFKAKVSQTVYKWKGKTSKLGTIAKNDKCYLLRGDESSDWVQVIYPASGCYKMGWVSGSDYAAMAGITLSNTVYKAKVNSFLSDSRWKVGASWGSSKSPQLSNWSSSGCCAYAADFAKYVFGQPSQSSGTYFTKASAIRSGDIIYATPTHWMVVLYRSGNTLDIVHGNWTNGKVCRSKATLDGSKIVFKSGSSTNVKTFSKGYHYK